MADNQTNWIGKDVDIKKGKNGVGDVSKPEKDAIIELAHGVWKAMGLSNEQIAALDATFNVESGFNSKAEHTDIQTHYVKSTPLTAASATYTTETHYIGLGQFDEATWGDAVNTYNKKSGETLDPTAERYDILSQIKVSGSHMKDTIYRRVDMFHNDDSLKNHSIQEVAYGLWHQGAYSKVTRVKTFLEGTGTDQFLNKKSGLSGSFNDTYDTIDAELQQRDAADKNLDNAEADKTLWDAVIEELKKFLDKSSTQDIIQQFIGQQSPEAYPWERKLLWEIEKAETGENPNESLER